MARGRRRCRPRATHAPGRRARARARRVRAGGPRASAVVARWSSWPRPRSARCSSDLLDQPAVAHWATIFVAIAVQAMPFLVLGVTRQRGHRGASCRRACCRGCCPSRPALAVPVAAVAGRRAARLRVRVGADRADGSSTRGAPPAAALTFLLSAPAINPVVLVATAVAFPGKPEVVGARLSPACSRRPSSAWSGRASAATTCSTARRRRHIARGPPLRRVRSRPRSTTCSTPAAS